MSKPKSIYIHLPFCKTKCPYCDFASFAGAESKIRAYLQALHYEIDSRLAYWLEGLNHKPVIETIFFGGGTPSVHSQAEIKAILDKLQEYCSFVDDIEITLEANPGTIDRIKLAEFKDIGINRISIGVQTFDEELLAKLGRGHSVEDSRQTIADIIACDFGSWSFDLIYGLPGQDLQSWTDTIEEAVSYNPYHISAYALGIEKDTPYGQIYGDSSHPDLPKEDTVIAMYEHAHSTFVKQGIDRYEISNWAKPGHEARHNLTYWRAEEYYAFGLGAHGYVDSRRYSNTRDLDEYIASALPGNDSRAYIDNNEKLKEKIMLGLRLDAGLQLDDEINQVLNQEKLGDMVSAGFVERYSKSIKLTDSGVMLSNKVIAELI